MLVLEDSRCHPIFREPEIVSGRALSTSASDAKLIEALIELEKAQINHKKPYQTRPLFSWFRGSRGAAKFSICLSDARLPQGSRHSQSKRLMALKGSLASHTETEGRRGKCNGEQTGRSRPIAALALPSSRPTLQRVGWTQERQRTVHQHALLRTTDRPTTIRSAVCRPFSGAHGAPYGFVER